LFAGRDVEDFVVVQSLVDFDGVEGADHGGVHLRKLLLVRQLHGGVAAPSVEAAAVVKGKAVLPACCYLLDVLQVFLN
jgi:hypothetical protein